MIDPWVGQLRVIKLAARICSPGLQRGSKFDQYWTKILASLAQIPGFWKKGVIFRNVHLRIELSTPNYISFATKYAFLALEMPKLELQGL